MTSWLLSLKGLLKKPLYLAALAAVLFLLILAGAVPRSTPMPACGFVSADASISQALLEMGLISYSDEASLQQALAADEIQYGCIVPADLTDRLEAGTLTGSLSWLEKPPYYLSSLFQTQISAVILRRNAPYLASRFLQQAGYAGTPEELEEAIQVFYEGGVPFSFSFLTRHGAVSPEASLASSLQLGTLAILFFCLQLLIQTSLFWEEVLPMAKRIGRQTATRQVLIPGLFWSVLLSWAVGAMGLLLGSALFSTPAVPLLLPLLIYLLVLAILSVVLAVLLPGLRQLQPMLLVLVLFSLVLCPIYLDFRRLLSLPGWLAALCPPCWLYRILDAPGIWAAAALLLSLGSFYGLPRISSETNCYRSFL